MPEETGTSTQFLVELYNKRPDLFTLNQADSLRADAESAGIPFQRNLDNDANQLVELPKQLLGGFIEGVTAFIDPFDAPKDEAGQIAHELGSLSGFVGSIFGLPVVGKALRLTLGAAAKGIQAAAAVDKALEVGNLASRLKTFATGVETLGKSVEGFRSVPMLGADFLGKKLGIDSAAKHFAKFFGNSIHAEAYFAQGAHLGLASSISSLHFGLLPALESGISGFVFGGTFGAIGDIPFLKAKTNVNSILKAMAGGIVQGLPSTIQGAPTATQVKDYLLGSYFGWHTVDAAHFNATKRLEQMGANYHGWELDPLYKDAPQKVKDVFEEVYLGAFKPVEARKGIVAILKGLGLSSNEAKKLAAEMEKVAEPADKPPDAPASDISEDRVDALSKHNQDFNETSVPLQDRMRRALAQITGKETISNEKYVGLLRNLEKEFDAIIEARHPKAFLEVKKYVNDYLVSQGKPPAPEEAMRPITQYFILKAAETDHAQGMLRQDVLNKVDIQKFDKTSDGNMYNGEDNLVEAKRPRTFIDLLHNDPELFMTIDSMKGKDGKIRKLSDINIVDELPETAIARKTKERFEKITSGGREEVLIDGKLVKVDDPNLRALIHAEEKKNFAVDPDPLSPKVLWRDIYRAGGIDMYLYGGNGDKAQFKYMKYHPNLETQKKRVLDEIKANPEWLAEYEVAKKHNKEHDYLSEADYEKATISNILYAEDYLGKGFKELDQDGFIRTALAFNKRQQPFFSDYSPGRADIAGFAGTNTVIVKDWDKLKATAFGQKLFKENSDGAWIMHSKDFDQLARSFGLPPGISALKPFVVSPNSELGTLIGKMAAHRATPEMDAMLDGIGARSIMPESAAKQRGLRTMYEFDVVDGKLKMHAGDGKYVDKPTNYEIPIDHIKVSFGTYDNSTAKLNMAVRLAKQIMDTMTDEQASPEARVAYTKYLEELFVSTPKASEYIKDFLTKTEEERAKIIDQAISYNLDGELNKNSLFNEMGFKDILTAMENSKLFRELARTVIARTGVTGMEGDGIDYTDAEGDKEVLDSDLQGAARYMAVSDGSDAVAMSKPVKKMMENMMTKFLIKNITSPKVRSAGSAILSPYTPDMWTKHKLLSGDEESPYGAATETGKAIVKFLNQYGIRIQEAGMSDANLPAMIDTIRKVAQISTAPGSDLKLSRVAAEYMSHMMSYHEDFYHLLELTRDSVYYKDFISQNPNATGNEKRQHVKELFRDLLEHGFDKAFAKEKGLKESALAKIKAWVVGFINKLKGADFNKIDTLIDDIVEKTIGGRDFIRTTNKPGYERVNFQTALDQNELGKAVLTGLSEESGIYLTGSLAFSTQGTVYRKSSDMLHDIDIVSLLSRQQNEALLLKHYPDAQKVYGFEQFGYTVDTYIVSPVGTHIDKIVRRSKEDGTGQKVISYSVIDNATGKEVGTYQNKLVLAHNGRINESNEVRTGVGGLFVDFFAGEKARLSSKTHVHRFVGTGGKKSSIQLGDYEGAFRAKLGYSRFKDVFDYNRFVENPTKPEYGNFFLGDVFKAMRIKGIDRNGVERDMSLEEQWIEYNHIKEAPGSTAEQGLANKDLFEKMQEKLTAVVLRVPMDDISGMQALRFGGFTGQAGGGMIIHGKNMQRLGGADLDIDKANFYFGMPKPMLEDLYKNRDSQAKYDDEFPGTMALLKRTGDLPLMDKFMGTFDPRTRNTIASLVAKGRNRNLGIAVSNKSTIGFLYTAIGKQIASGGTMQLKDDIEIISGGQTGADRGGLEGAVRAGLKTGGMAPKGYKTERGNDPNLQAYGLTESPSADYTHRTEENIKNADITLIFGNVASPGSRATIGFAKAHKKEYLLNPTIAEAIEKINEVGAKRVNIAGNRESVSPGIQKKVSDFVVALKAGQKGSTDGWYEGDTFRLHPRQDDGRMFRALARAGIKMSADVGAEGGMVTGDELKAILIHAAFDKIQRKFYLDEAKTKFKWLDVIQDTNIDVSTKNPKLKLSTYLMGFAQKGIKTIPEYDALYDVNSKLYGYNYKDGRPWTHDEIRYSAAQFMKATLTMPVLEGHPKMAVIKQVAVMDWQENNMVKLASPAKVDGFIKGLEKVHILFNAADTRGIMEDLYPFLGKQSEGGRFALNVPQLVSRLEAVQVRKLTNERDIARLAKKDDSYRLFVEDIKKAGGDTSEAYHKHDPDGETLAGTDARKRFIREQITFVDDMIGSRLKDLSTVVGLGRIYDRVDGMTPEYAKEILAQVATSKALLSPKSDTKLTMAEKVDRILRERKAVFYRAKELGIDPDGAVDFYNAALHGSITNTATTTQVSRPNNLVPLRIVKEMEAAYTEMFNTAESSPEKMANIMKQTTDVIKEQKVVAEEPVEKTVHRYIHIDPSMMGDIKDPEVSKLVNRIVHNLKYSDAWTAENFFGVMRELTGKAQISDMDIYDLRGMDALMSNIRRGPGLFQRFFGTDQDPVKWIGFGTSLQFAPTVAEKLRRKDMQLYATTVFNKDGTINAGATPLKHYNTEKQMYEQVFAETYTPLSAHGRQIQVRMKADVHNLQGQTIQRDEIDKQLSPFVQPIYVAGTSDASHTERLFQLAVAQLEYRSYAAEELRVLKQGGDGSRAAERRDFYFQQLKAQEKYEAEVQEKVFDFMGKPTKGKDVLEEMNKRWQSVTDWFYHNRIAIDDQWIKDNVVSTKGIIDLTKSWKDVLSMNTQYSITKDDLRRMTIDGSRLVEYYETLVNNVDRDIAQGGVEFKKKDGTHEIRAFEVPKVEDIVRLRHGPIALIAGKFPKLQQLNESQQRSYIETYLKGLKEGSVKDLEVKDEGSQAAVKLLEIHFKNPEAKLPSREDALSIKSYFSHEVQEHEARYRLHGIGSFSQRELDLMRARGQVELREYLYKSRENAAPFTFTNRLEGYFPHGEYNQQVLEAHFQTQFDKLTQKFNVLNEDDAKKKNTPDDKGVKLMSDSEFKQYSSMHNDINRLMARTLGEMRNPDGLITEETARSLVEEDYSRSIEHLQKLGGGTTPGNLLKREADLPGYRVNPDVIIGYGEKLNNAIYSNYASFQMKRIIADMKKRAPFGEQTKNVEFMMRAYARDTLGLASIFPESVLNDPTLDLKSQPYYMVSDQAMYDVTSRMGKAKDWLFGKDATPEQVGDKLRSFKSWEARYEMAALLFSSRSLVTNIVHGSLIDAAYNGMRHIVSAHKLSTWQTINPNWKSMADVRAWVNATGAIEGYMIDEGNIVSRRYGAKWTKFRDAFFEKLRSNPEFSDKSLMQLANDYGVINAFVDGSASMMRYAERITRQNAWMSSYLALREVLEPIRVKYDNPWLLEKATAALGANQYFYTQATKSAFARTNVGQVLSRYKLWGWQSAKSRRDIYDRALEAGLRPGSHEFERFKRRILTDTFLTGLATLLPYSIFGGGLPPPMSWFANFATWIFGDSKEKAGAFNAANNGLPYALAPLGEILPPISRFPKGIYDLPGTFKLIWGGELARVGEYSSYSIFPFGRQTKDVLRAWDNPERALDILTGLPTFELARIKKESEED